MDLMMIRRAISLSKLMAMQIQATILEKIREAPGRDPKLQEFREQVEVGLRSDMQIHTDGTLCFGNRICAPKGEVRQEVLAEAHSSAYFIHPGGMKMYQDLKQQFWWHGMKREIARYVTKCLVCQQVKAEHQRTAGLLQPLLIPEWKWEHITMDFITALPRNQKSNNAV